MIPSWNHFNYRIKHQLYLRILPVVVLAVLAVGFFSGRLLTNRAVNTYLEQKAERQSASLQEILSRIIIRSLTAEAQKEECLSRIGHAAPATAVCRDVGLLGKFLATESVAGAALLPPGPTSAPDSLFTMLRPELDNAVNHGRMDAWGQYYRGIHLSLEVPAYPPYRSFREQPRMVAIDEGHGLWIFPALQLQEQRELAGEVWQPGPDSKLLARAVLPVVVRDSTPLNAAAPPVGSRWRMRPEILLLLDISSLVTGCLDAGGAQGEVGMLIDTPGRILAASADTLAAGYDLTAPDQDVIEGVTAAELKAFFHRPGLDCVHAYPGPRLNPYVLVMSRRADLPFLMVSGLPFSKIHGGLVLYTAIVVLMATIALLGSILAITRVGERLSDRLQTMSANMEEVARGDYSLRMPVGESDEVGRLISYFNLMTGGLEEVHDQLREQTQRLRRALTKMQLLDKAKDDFLSLISHEVRTPLTAIMGGIDFLKLVITKTSEEQKQALADLNLLEIADIIASSGGRLSGFMNDAILMASLQTTNAAVDYFPVPVHDIMALVLDGLKEEIQTKQLEISDELGHTSYWNALCDRDMMITVFDKLLRNAVQHNVPGGRVRITEVDEIPGIGMTTQILAARRRRDMARSASLTDWKGMPVEWRILCIFNTGPIIPPQKREALFNKFELVEHIEHHHKGSGLSLAIVQAILESHGGTIHVHSEEGKGNYFYLLLPTLAFEPVAAAPSGHQQGQGLGGVAGNEEIGPVGEGAAFDVELEHTRT